MFRSAAYIYGSRVIGIALSGALDDGTSGLWTVKHRGGIAIVQDPDEAEVSSMPQNAMAAVQVDYCLPVADIATLSVKLTEEFAQEAEQVDMEEQKRPAWKCLLCYRIRPWSKYCKAGGAEPRAIKQQQH